MLVSLVYHVDPSKFYILFFFHEFFFFWYMSVDTDDLFIMFSEIPSCLARQISF